MDPSGHYNSCETGALANLDATLSVRTIRHTFDKDPHILSGHPSPLSNPSRLGARA